MSKGLEGVVAAETVLSHVDGEAGRLIVRGHDIESLAGRVTYEDAVAVLWRGVVGDAGSRELKDAIASGRMAAYRRFLALLPLLPALAPIEIMRFMVSTIGDGDSLAEPASLVGGFGTAAALAIRASQGQKPLPPDPSSGHARDILRMIRGDEPDELEIRNLDTYLVTVIDHGLNASTFTARVVASTAAGLPSALMAALSALKGPLHGGAPGPVLDMLDEIAVPENAGAWVEAALDDGERLMGFGHRIYRVRDPRADVLKEAIRPLKGRANRIGLAEEVEKAALAALARRKPGRRLDVNVEFYTALLLEALSIPRAGFLPIFAAARSAGWAAHVREQEATGRIIRPQSRYIGPVPSTATRIASTQRSARKMALESGRAL